MKNQTEKKIDRRIFKKTPEELEQYMYFRRRGFCLQNKKGKGSYQRHAKHRDAQFGRLAQWSGSRLLICLRQVQFLYLPPLTWVLRHSTRSLNIRCKTSINTDFVSLNYHWRDVVYVNRRYVACEKCYIKKRSKTYGWSDCPSVHKQQSLIMPNWRNADASDLGSDIERCESSSLLFGTIKKQKKGNTICLLIEFVLIR